MTQGFLSGKRVLVTGATGFIGHRLAERLAVEEGALVTGVGRNLSRAADLIDVGVQLRQADLTTIDSWSQLVDRQLIVFHLAAWLRQHGTPALATAVNVDATEHLVRAAAAAGVQRFVHVSSIAAYGPPAYPVYDESVPVDTEQPLLYGRTKAQGERRAAQLAAELGFDLVVIRPAQVYGPASKEWTVDMLELVRKRFPVVLGGGQGQVHPIYIDNLIDGLLLAAMQPQAAGEAFNLAGPPITWHRFFSYYGRMSGRRLWGVPLWAGRLIATVNDLLQLGLPLTRQTIKFYEAHTRYPTTRAEALLGYAPRVSLDEGMALTEAWLRRHGHLLGREERL